MRRLRRIRHVMGTFMEIVVCGPAPRCMDGLEAAFTEMARIESLLSVYQPASEIARLNRTPHAGFFLLSAEVLHVVSLALHYADLTDGAYDPTLGPLIRQWGFGPPKDAQNTYHDTVVDALRCVGFRHLTVRKDGIERRIAGMEINLGGLGKGYAIDRAVHLLQAAGIPSGRVHCGSTTRVWGEDCSVAIRHPRRADQTLGCVALRDAALSTSGDDEKRRVVNGRVVHHLIDPRSGAPARGVASASVIAPTAAATDALSTAAFILGETRFLARCADTEGWVVREGETAGAPPRVFAQSSRRRFLAMAASLLLGVLLPWRAQGAVVYLTEDEALRMMMPQADAFLIEEAHLSAAQLDQAQAQAGRAFRKSQFQFHVGRRGETTVGYAIILDVIGKERPITFLVGIAPNGAILGLEVLIYRESQGDAVRHRRFTGQFLKKQASDPLRLGSDIQPISGATLSSRAAVYATRKALAIFSAVHPSGVPASTQDEGLR